MWRDYQAEKEKYQFSILYTSASSHEAFKVFLASAASIKSSCQRERSIRSISLQIDWIQSLYWARNELYRYQKCSRYACILQQQMYKICEVSRICKFSIVLFLIDYCLGKSKVHIRPLLLWEKNSLFYWLLLSMIISLLKMTMIRISRQSF